ncbi:integrase [Actinokineospora diospyrosa]|uniref:Phage integrase family n=1 Tax=Actinokineospora diospyrosa TaxID=103728 RepID=A0ABT1I6G2_9PSEU|nr:integrase [Actinokineospora diospyrosa]MCP2268188.1 Phage integrase family [Actinokineospora diospyrosa]
MVKSYKVKIWAIEARQGKKSNTYRVAWLVDGERFQETFSTRTLADGFRSSLVSATRKGEAFDTESGLPTSLARKASALSWYDFAIRYADMKWGQSAAKSRAGVADTLATAMPALITGQRGRPDPKVIRRALVGWAYNSSRRDQDMPAEVAEALKWLASNTVEVSALDDVALLRRVLDAISVKMDGEHAGAKTVLRKRAVFHNALEYALELEVLGVNRLSAVKWKVPKTVTAIDKRVVVNPRQGAGLIAAVGAQVVDGQPRRSAGPMLRGYFASMFYAALRPAEAAMLGRTSIRGLPGSGWGELHLSDTAPIAGAAWTDTGERRDRRGLKHRARQQVRVVPSPPPLTAILNQHVEQFGFGADGRLFRSLTGGPVAESTAARVWDNARKAALTEEEYASPTAARPYDLRHACVSTWLAAGVQPAQIAEWAGHSLWVLLQIYASVIAGLEHQARQRIDQALLGLDRGGE